MEIVLAVNCLLMTAILTIIVLITLRLRSLLSSFDEFISSRENGLESPASELYGLLIKRLAVELKMTIMGTIGGQAKANNKAVEDAAQSIIQDTNPGIAAALSSIPGLKKMALKNPALLEFVMNRLAKPAASSPGGNNDGDYAARLGKYGG